MLILYVPRPDLRESAKCFKKDDLIRQVVSAIAIFQTIKQGPDMLFKNIDPINLEPVWGPIPKIIPPGHVVAETQNFTSPGVTMWYGYTPALCEYGYWLSQSMRWMLNSDVKIGEQDASDFFFNMRDDLPTLPWWINEPQLHISHQSAMIREDPGVYGTMFHPTPDYLPLWWPDR